MLSQPLVLVNPSIHCYWHWTLQISEEVAWSFSGKLATAELGDELLLSLVRGNMQHPWVAVRVLRTTPTELGGCCA